MGKAGTDSLTAKQILVFGSAGTGKTSFVNAITGENLPTGDGASGETLASQEVFTSRGRVDYRIIDTVGLNEARNGGVSSAQALTGLVHLLSRTEGGLNLMVMVMKKGRIFAAEENNYKLFVQTMADNKVPFVIVVTGCEREHEDMQGWVEANRQAFDKVGIGRHAIVATTFVTPDPEFDRDVEAMGRKVQKSVELSWGAIEKHSTAERVDFMKMNGGFLSIVRKMYNFVAHFFTGLFGAKSALWMWVSKDYVDLIHQVGDFPSRKDAENAAKEIVVDANYGN